MEHIFKSFPAAELDFDTLCQMLAGAVICLPCSPFEFNRKAARGHFSIWFVCGQKDVTQHPREEQTSRRRPCHPLSFSHEQTSVAPTGRTPFFFSLVVKDDSQDEFRVPRLFSFRCKKRKRVKNKMAIATYPVVHHRLAG